MHVRLEISARRHRQWLKVLLWTAIALFILLPAGIPNAAKAVAGGTAQLPAALRQLAQVDTLSAPEALKAFKQGVEAYFNERYSAALDILPDEQVSKTTNIADYILLYRAKSNLMMDRDKEALDELRLLENRYPDSSLLREALLGQCQALLKLHDPKSALTLLKNPKIDRDSEASYYEARALELEGEKEKAIEHYLLIYSRYPKSDSSVVAERNLLALSRGALSGRCNYGARLQRAENLLNANDARGARPLLLALGRIAAPDSTSAQRRNFLLADAEYRLGRTLAALSHLRTITAADPALHARAIRLEGACYRKLDRETALLALRDRALKLYPHSADTEEVCYLVAAFFDVHYESSKAWEAYKVLLERFPKGRHVERSLWKLALFHYFRKEYREAALEFWHFLLAYPNPLQANSSMYWMGRCYEMLGGSKEAGYLYARVQALANDSYFGQCARKAGASLEKTGDADTISVPGIDFAQVIATCNGTRLPAILMPEPSAPAVAIIERARQLWASGLPDLAIAELRWGSRRYSQDDKSISYIVSRIHASKGNYTKAIAGLRGMFPDYTNRSIAELPQEIWQLLFPIRHWNILMAQAAKVQVDPSLILGIIRQESAFNENARSAADARGLMQILSSTGPKLARQVRLTRYSGQKLYQAETNIILGTYYLASLLRHYGRIELALAAYNAGESRVDRWLREFGNVDMPEFVEQIPFSETRGYIKQVISNQALYNLLASSAATANP